MATRRLSPQSRRPLASADPPPRFQRAARPGHPNVTGASSGVSSSGFSSRVLAERIVEQAPHALVALEIATWRITLANRAARQLIARVRGGDERVFTGEPLDALLPWLAERGMLAHLDLAVRTGEPSYDLALDVPGAPTTTEPAYWCCDIVPLGESGERPAALLLSIRNVTEERLERQRVEQRAFAAQLYAERLEAILEQIAEAVTVRDTDGVLLAYNRAALAFARNRRAVVLARARGERLEPRWVLLSPDGVPVAEIERPSARALLTGAPVAGRQYLLRGEGKRQTPVLVHATPLRDELGAITGVIVAFQDITAVRDVERLKDEFISVASHELRQPLTVIQGQAQMLKRQLRKMANDDTRKPLTADALQTMADGVETQTARLNLLVSDLLDISRLQAGQLKLEPAPTRLVALVRRVVELQRQTTLEHEFHLAVDPIPGGGELTGKWDSRRIEQILLNLLSNAVKYSPAGGHINLRITRIPAGESANPQRGRSRRVEGPAALLAITDEGIGIPANAIARLFERFYRAPNTGSIQGTGLGLYICRQLAWAHGGDLWAESGGIGTGSTFKLVLPLPKA